jgi:hypothetical protein
MIQDQRFSKMMDSTSHKVRIEVFSIKDALFNLLNGSALHRLIQNVTLPQSLRRIPTRAILDGPTVRVRAGISSSQSLASVSEEATDMDHE